MKSLFCALAIMAAASTVNAAPFLVCDPPLAEEQIISYKIYQDGVEVATVLKDESGEYGFEYDLNGVSPGAYSFTAEAVNAWGASAPSDPYMSPADASRPAGLKMTLQP
jgi:hypothetical protein